MNEETISLGELFSILKRSKWLIASLTVTAAIIAFLISSFVISPTYEASTQVLVAPKQTENTIDLGQVQSSINLVNTYRVIIQSPAILEAVQENVVGAPADISELITVNSEQNSQVINLKVQHTNPVLATDIANEISSVFASEVPELMSGVDNVKVLSEASIPMSPVKPNILLNTAIAAVLGMMIGVAIAFLKVVLDRRIKTEQDVENILELPVLGSIPVIEKVDMKQQRQPRVKGEEVRV
ncbi:YveK family protein [Exiguobacterium alkaliphilum]|uniref:YveK family protein n=1 Tax=Exiguobacterium alkaliphilum TaxID=1428684 RepID=UPI0005541A5A|nr:Wzz/FepE/Etk N-terminal domain-containing protein [Exiguobacterium alkaliphilum]